MNTQTRLVILACLLTTAACDAEKKALTDPAPTDTSTTTVTSTDPLPGLERQAPAQPAPAASDFEIDRAGRVTAMDQGKTLAETEITAAVRRGVVADENLSFMAKNVQIITNGTAVTLHGPVENEREHFRIVAIARQAAGVNEVDDQLIVTPLK